MPPAADRVTGPPEQRQDEAGHDGNDADRPENAYSGDESDDEENDAENDQVGLLAGSRRAARRQEIIGTLCRPDSVARAAARGAGPAGNARDRRAPAFPLSFSSLRFHQPGLICQGPRSDQAAAALP